MSCHFWEAIRKPSASFQVDPRAFMSFPVRKREWWWKATTEPAFMDLLRFGMPEATVFAMNHAAVKGITQGILEPSSILLANRSRFCWPRVLLKSMSRKGSFSYLSSSLFFLRIHTHTFL